MKANANNPQYGQTLLNTLGPEGTLKLADQLEKIGGDRDAKNKEGYSQLQTNLANTVAGATRDPNSKFYQDWRKGMKDIGDKNLGRNTSPVYGYQALATLMDKGDAQYSKEYLNDLGADIIDVEKKHPQIWSHQFDGERQDLVSDPLDGVLKQMGKNPEAATGFLDPDAPGAKDRLDYLLRDRKWPENYMNPLYGAPIKMDDPLQRSRPRRGTGGRHHRRPHRHRAQRRHAHARPGPRHAGHHRRPGPGQQGPGDPRQPPQADQPARSPTTSTTPTTSSARSSAPPSTRTAPGRRAARATSPTTAPRSPG